MPHYADRSDLRPGVAGDLAFDGYQQWEIGR
jgi:hypothetical protein